MSSNSTAPRRTRASPIVCAGAQRRSVGLPGIEDLKAVLAALVQRQVGVPEHDRVGARKARAQARQAAGALAAVVDHGDARPGRLGRAHGRQHVAQLRRVHVAVHGGDRPVGLDFPRHRSLDEVAGVQDQVSRVQVLDARGGNRAVALRHVRVGHDRQQHGDGRRARPAPYRRGPPRGAARRFPASPVSPSRASFALDADGGSGRPSCATSMVTVPRTTHM